MVPNDVLIEVIKAAVEDMKDMKGRDHGIDIHLFQEETEVGAGLLIREDQLMLVLSRQSMVAG